MPEDIREEDINEEIRRLREELDRDSAGTFESESSKTVSIQDPGGSRVDKVSVLLGQTVNQVIDMILPRWHLPRPYHIDRRTLPVCASDSGMHISGMTYTLKKVKSEERDERITGDLYKAVKDGDKLVLEHTYYDG